LAALDSTDLEDRRGSGAAMKRIYVDGKSTGFVVAKDLAAIMAELPPEPANVIPSNCVARTSLCDGVQQHLLRSLFRLRMTCNNA
jgi:hypothetical protein